jgi:hypothetical protein
MLLQKTYSINNCPPEDIVWSRDVKPILEGLPVNVMSIWNYGFCEIFNNAIDHSGGSEIVVSLERSEISTNLLVRDNGRGIFKKIQQFLVLYEERHALLELAKGKLTTDPERHAGQGIFFSSRAFDEFFIYSDELYFGSDRRQIQTEHLGTTVFMSLANHSDRTMKSVFDEFSSGEDYEFNKTSLPVRLIKEDSLLVSRSQAKRLLSGCEKFETVILDFSEVDYIGQAFADEAFRVWTNQHPTIELIYVNACEDIVKMIRRARNNTILS